MTDGSMSGRSEERSYCPSAQPDWKGSFAFGIVEGTPQRPEVRYLSQPVVVSQELLELTKPVSPTEVLRFAAPCAASGCQHFISKGGVCRLAVKIVEHAPVAGPELPACVVRSVCRWFKQEGIKACLRCPLVVTDRYSSDPLLRRVADPLT